MTTVTEAQLRKAMDDDPHPQGTTGDWVVGICRKVFGPFADDETARNLDVGCCPNDVPDQSKFDF